MSVDQSFTTHNIPDDNPSSTLTKSPTLQEENTFILLKENNINISSDTKIQYSSNSITNIFSILHPPTYYSTNNFTPFNDNPQTLNNITFIQNLSKKIMENPNDLSNIQEILNLIINNKPTSNYEHPAIFNKIKNLDRQFF